jgi:hypothetical protein
MKNFNILPKDTDLAAYKVQLSILKDMPPQKKLDLLFQLNEQLKTLKQKDIKIRHPDYDEEMVKMAYLKLIFGEKVFDKVFPHMIGLEA